MKITGWQLFIWAVSLLAIAMFAYKAFSVPWSWTFEQWLMIFILVVALVQVGAWTHIWVRGGTNAVKARWGQVQHIGAKPLRPRTLIRNVAIWFFLTIFLVVIFQLLKR
jgi:hypothetical protein